MKSKDKTEIEKKEIKTTEAPTSFDTHHDDVIVSLFYFQFKINDINDFNSINYIKFRFFSFRFIYLFSTMRKLTFTEEDWRQLRPIEPFEFFK